MTLKSVFWYWLLTGFRMFGASNFQNWGPAVYGGKGPWWPPWHGLICTRAVARSENPGVPVLFGGHNLLPLVEIGLTDLPKSGGAPPGTTGLYAYSPSTPNFKPGSMSFAGRITTAFANGWKIHELFFTNLKRKEKIRGNCIKQDWMYSNP